MADGNCIEKWLQLTKRNKTIANRGSPSMNIKHCHQLINMSTTRIIGIFILLATFSCKNETSEDKFLNNIFKTLDNEYQTSIKRTLNTIKESPADNAAVKKKALVLDSLYQEAIKRINDPEIDNKKDEISRFLSFLQQNLFPDEKLDLKISEELPSNHETQYALIAASQISKEIIDKLALEIKYFEYVFDNVDIFIEAEKYKINSNENYEAKIYFAAYNTQLEKFSEIYVNGEKLEVKNGIGFLSLKPSKKGKQKLQFVVKVKNESSIGDWKTEKTIEYVLK